jgi:hypothetical protein
MKYARDQKTGDMGFAGMNNTRVARDLTKYEHNQWSGHANDGRTVQMPQSPNRKGNDGSCGHSGYSMTGRKPPVSSMPAVPAAGSARDNINRGAQVRGGGMAMPRTGRETFRMPAGPRKGNQQ